MNKYRAEAKYKRINPKTELVEETGRFIIGEYSNKGAAEAELMKQVNLDEVVGKVSITTKRVA
jgi:hypothetical protein